jgi:anti-sigma regulatory factor (Ser/Thr protein kinase)
VGTLPVRHEPSSAAVVRQQLSQELSRWRVEQSCIADAVLVASELVANAVRHAPPTASESIEVSWDFSDESEPDSLVIRVQDGSHDAPEQRTVTETSPYGRGLAIVAALAADWGVEPTGTGKSVWARVPLRH